MAEGEQENRRRTSPRLAAASRSNLVSEEPATNRENNLLSSHLTDSVNVSLGEDLSSSQAYLHEAHYTSLTTPGGISTSPVLNSAREEMKQWGGLSSKLKERGDALFGTSWRPLIFTFPTLMVEALVHVDAPGPRWTMVTANGGIYSVTLAVLMKKREEYIAKRHQEIQWFDDELIPSLVDYLFYRRVPDVVKEWGEVCHPLSNKIWYTFRCTKCNKERRLKTEHARTVLKCIPREKRRCEHLGIDCITPITELRHSPPLKTLEACISLTGDVLPVIPEDMGRTSPWIGRGEARTPASRQDRMEQQAFPWQHHQDSNVVSILKALGKQGVAIKPYDGTGGGAVLHAWQDALTRHFRLFELKGDEEQVTFAVCFLEGKARDWWEQVNVSGQVRDINNVDDLTHYLRVHFKPLQEDINLSMEWRRTQQTADINTYKQAIYQLQTQFPIGEVAEFCMAYHGLKQELRPPILSELWKRNARHLPLQLMFELAAQAEVAAPASSTLFPRFSEKLKEESRKSNKTGGNRWWNSRPMGVFSGQKNGENERQTFAWSPTIRHGYQGQQQHGYQQQQQQQPVEQRGVYRTPQLHQGENRAMTMNQRRSAEQIAWMKQRVCWICDKPGHLNQECHKKKDTGCLRCGGSHMLRDCPQRPKTVGMIICEEDSGEDELARMISIEDRIRGDDANDQEGIEQEQSFVHDKGKREDLGTKGIFEVKKQNHADALKYTVMVKGKPIEAVVDTGAQLSLMNEETAILCEVEWGRVESTSKVTSANGQDMRIIGKASLQIEKEGHTKEVEIYISTNLQQELLLGLPWIRKYAPIIDWSELTLEFPTGETWEQKGSYRYQKCQLNGRNAAEEAEQYALILVKHQHNDLQDEEELQPQKEEDVPPAIRQVLEQEAKIFEPLQGIPPEERIKHTIVTTPNCRPVMKRAYRMSEAQNQEITKQIIEALDQGWLQPSYSQWGTAIFPVGKKTGEWRMCTDYRDLNALTELDAYPLPRIDDILHKVAKGKIFSTLDLQKGYHQIQIEEKDRHKTAFRLSQPVRGCSHFEWTVMPFGLKNAPPTFQRYMSLVLKNCYHCAEVYMDDIIIFSSSMSQHIKDLQLVLRALKEADLKVRRSKCFFAVEQVEFLGHELRNGRIWMQPAKQKQIEDWPSPLLTPKAVRRFIGLASYYRNFVPGFATVAAPLIDLTRKRKVIKWTWETEQAMKQIKEAISKQISRVCWDAALPTRVTTDASGTGLGAVLEQEHPDEGWLTVALWSRAINSCQRNYSILDREWLAILEAVTRVWRHWLTGISFIIQTDHAPLKQILTKKIEELTPRQLRWLERLEPFSYTVVYLKGEENRVADALSRRMMDEKDQSEGTREDEDRQNIVRKPELEEDRDEETRAIAIVEIAGRRQDTIDVDDLQGGGKEDEFYQRALIDEAVREQLQVTLHEGIMRTKEGQIWVPFDMILRFKLILEHHDQPCMGHWDFRRTLALLQRHFYWPMMAQDVQEVIRTCDICQRTKIQRTRDSAPIRFIEAQYPWEVITIDFVSGFKPTRRKHTAIVVICDRYTRMIHLEPCSDHPTAKDTAKMVLRMVFARHGCPRVILSDRGTQFDSELWHALWTMMGTRIHMASTHHPQTNGLTERMNRTLIDLIKKATHTAPHMWDEMLPLFEFAYNQTPNATTGAAPFMAAQGYIPPTPATLMATMVDIPAASQGVKEFISRIRNTYQAVHELIDNNERNQQTMIRRREDRKRRGPTFHQGDEVLMYWPPFEGYSTTPRKHRLRYAGPFIVRRVISPSCVQLDGLPPRMPDSINIEYLHLYNRPESQALEDLIQHKRIEQAL